MISISWFNYMAPTLD